jgi:hypothetical protein
MTCALRFFSVLVTCFVLAMLNNFQLAAQTPAAKPSPTATGSTAEPRQLQLEPLKTLPVKGKRWALVVGVDKYADPQISPLRGAANDARMLADTLVRYAGFPSDQVILLATDQPDERQPTRVNLLRRLSNLAAAVPKDGLLLVSFSGHGIERGGHAFLLPSDAQISDQISFLEDTAVSVTRMRELIRDTRVAQVMVLLDACRNDPGGRADAPNNMTQAYVNGFNFDVRNREVQAFATIYATAVGQRAYEYTEKKQGYFTWAIVEALRGNAANPVGEVTLSELVKYVQDAVPKRIAIDLGSGKQQRPFATIEGYKAEELVLSAPGAKSGDAAAVPTGTFIDPAAIELSFWDSIKTSTNPEDFKAYLAKYPDGQFAELAKLRAHPSSPGGGAADPTSTEVAYWNAIKDSRSPAGFNNYVTKFPNGLFVDLAKTRIEELEADAKAREVAKEAAEAMQVDGSLWVGKTDKNLTARFEFKKGGMFSGTYTTIVEGILIDDYPTITMTGNWRQNGDSVNVQLSQPTKGFLQGSLTDLSMQASLAEGTTFSLQKVLMKPLSSSQGQSPCNLTGFKVKILYRKKDKVDRAQEAEQLAAKLKSFGAQVEVEKLNWKDAGTSLQYHNGQGEIGQKIADCLKDIMTLKVVDGKETTEANQFTLWLQL